MMFKIANLQICNLTLKSEDKRTTDTHRGSTPIHYFIIAIQLVRKDMNVNEHEGLLFPTTKKRVKTKVQMYLLFVYFQNECVENFRKVWGFHRSSKSKNRQYNGQNKQDKGTNGDLQSNVQRKLMIEKREQR